MLHLKVYMHILNLEERAVCAKQNLVRSLTLQRKKAE